MANLVITNNGNPNSIPATYDSNGLVVTPEIPADPAITYTDNNGIQTVIQPGACSSFNIPTGLTVTGA